MVGKLSLVSGQVDPERCVRDIPQIFEDRVADCFTFLQHVVFWIVFWRFGCSSSLISLFRSDYCARNHCFDFEQLKTNKSSFLNDFLDEIKKKCFALVLKEESFVFCYLNGSNIG